MWSLRRLTDQGIIKVFCRLQQPNNKLQIKRIRSPTSTYKRKQPTPVLRPPTKICNRNRLFQAQTTPSKPYYVRPRKHIISIVVMLCCLKASQQRLKVQIANLRTNHPNRRHSWLWHRAKYWMRSQKGDLCRHRQASFRINLWCSLALFCSRRVAKMLWWVRGRAILCQGLVLIND